MDPDGAMIRQEVSTGAKKRPPKLKNTDRTISITIENYKPPAPVIVDDGMILEEIDSLPPHPSSAPLDDYNQPNIFYVDGGSTGAISYDDYSHGLYAARRASFRRSDTLDVSAPGLLQMRKTRSFHTNEPPTVEDVLMARRTSSSVRNSLLYPNELAVAPLATPEHSPSSDRRNCSMHRSFNDAQKQRIMSRRDAMKCHSFSENIYPDDSEERRTDVKKFSSANVSLENELFRSRSNSRTHSQQGEETVDIRVEYSPRPARPAVLKRQMTTVHSPEPAHALTKSTADASIKLPETRSSYESRRSSLGFDTIGDVDYDAVLRSYRQSHRTRRKSSTASRSKSKRTTDFDESDESIRKRKKIVCIVTTVFVSLVFATVFVVIVSLAHSSSSTQTHTKSQKFYPVTRGLPLHYNVRQENERLMQESLNRAKFAKNFTDSAALTAQEEIP
uniref:Putative conserved plasma membrane protein n=1 Tax=Lutzomyia longipalpis TaxID=7200 RepID=A0A1B0CQD8_LUTLO